MILLIFAAVKSLEMKLNKSLIVAFILLIVIGVLFRVAGYAPQIAMAIFGAAVIRDKKLAFFLPLFTMFLSDVAIEVLFRLGYMNYSGFYAGQNFYDSQMMNYILLALITFMGFWARNLNLARIAAITISAPTLFFLLSNFFVWMAGSGLVRPKTFGGLMQAFADGLPFYRTSLATTVIFSVVLFGSYFLMQPKRKLA